MCSKNRFNYKLFLFCFIASCIFTFTNAFDFYYNTANVAAAGQVCQANNYLVAMFTVLFISQAAVSEALLQLNATILRQMI